MVRGAALVGWLAVGFPRILPLIPFTRFNLWVLIWGSFGALFWLAREPALGRRVRIGLLAGQTLAALAMCLASRRHGFDVTLLVIVAAQLPRALSPAPALGWLLVQTALFYLTGFSSMPLVRALDAALGAALQAFALGAVLLYTREQRAREELGRLNRQLREAQRLLADRSRLAERVRISRELHDVLGHHLTALNLNLEVARHVASGPAAPPVQAAHGLGRQLLAEIREVVGTLRTHEEGDGALADALRELAADIPSPTCHLQLPADLDHLGAAPAQVVLRCVQEIITNAVRHADARNLWIEIARVPEGLRIDARDDGRGTGAIQPGHGLRGMRERLEEAGGGLQLHSTPGAGFQLTALLATAAGPA